MLSYETKPSNTRFLRIKKKHTKNIKQKQNKHKYCLFFFSLDTQTIRTQTDDTRTASTQVRYYALKFAFKQIYISYSIFSIRAIITFKC